MMLAALVLAMAAPALHAQDAAQPEASAPPQAADPRPAVRPMPSVAMRNPRPARAAGADPIDIPQWAKDEGHNGAVRLIATVGADGKLGGLTVERSSNSEAIDAAARAEAEGLYYFAATDPQGNPVAGTASLRFEYARHDADSPGGGLEDYTCADLTREYGWFTRANAGVQRIFWLENAYTSLASIEQMAAGTTPAPAERLALRQARERMWRALLRRCERAPEKLLLDEVEEPLEYRRLVESF